MKAFTLIELIFVIVIVGIISMGALNAIPDNTLKNNTHYIYSKILEKKANALGFIANMDNEDENRTVCITFTKDWLKQDEKLSKVKFDLSNRIEITPQHKTICFDYLSRPHKGKVDLIKFDNLLYNSSEINISYNKKQETIIIYPMTGDIQIK